MWELFGEIYSGNSREGLGESQSIKKAFYILKYFAFQSQDPGGWLRTGHTDYRPEPFDQWNYDRN